MTVSFRLIGYDILETREAKLILKENSTVRDALIIFLEDNDVGVSLKELLKSQFIVNSKASNASTVLHDGDKLTVIRLLGGG